MHGRSVRDRAVVHAIRSMQHGQRDHADGPTRGRDDAWDRATDNNKDIGV